jgi:hypothetical protein
VTLPSIESGFGRLVVALIIYQIGIRKSEYYYCYWVLGYAGWKNDADGTPEVIFLAMVVIKQILGIIF